MKCDKCNGTGYVDKPRILRVPGVITWERGHLESTKCPCCGGSGSY